jgi:hypothetical protein
MTQPTTTAQVYSETQAIRREQHERSNREQSGLLHGYEFAS